MLSGTIVPHPMPERHIVLVSGAPGAGKTTLAVPLALGLGLPLFSKDHIKEALFDALEGPAHDLAFSQRISAAAMDVLWTMAAWAPGAVLEANFRPHSEYERVRVLGLAAEVVEVYCACPPEEAARRFATRAALGRHTAHPLTELSAEMLAEYSRPIGIGTVLHVDTSGPVDIPQIAARVRAAWVQ
jgi:predicted kinase